MSSWNKQNRYMPNKQITPKKASVSNVCHKSVRLCKMYVAYQIGVFKKKRNSVGCFRETYLSIIEKCRSFRTKKEYIEIRGSVTIEAAVILPLLLLTMYTVLGFTIILDVQLRVYCGLYKAGREIAQAAYLHDQIENSEYGEYVDFSSQIFSQGYVRGMVRKELKESVAEKVIEGGMWGIRFTETEILKEEDMVDLIVRYQVRLPVRVVPLPSIHLVQRCRMHGWVGGYSEQAEPREQQVFITPTGTVYHVHPACTYLKLSIKKVLFEEVDEKRNKEGAKYAPCELCVEDDHLKKVYITDYGERYHQSSECSGLKRGIMQVGISQVGNRTACSKCGG